MSKRIVSVLLSLSFIMVMLFGINMTANAEEAAEAPKASIIASRDETSDAVDASGGESTQGTEAEEPYDVNPLTGLAGLAESAIGKRPVAVMINNHPDSYPQYNISQADVIFEVVVEHDLTRLMALFADYQNVPYLVSVRSYRYYFPQISNGFDAFYIHWGEDLTMMDTYYNLNLDSYDGISNSYLFGRDEERLNMGYDLEHTSCFYGYLLPDQLAADGKRTDLREEFLGDAFNFVPYGTVRVPGDENCNFVDVQYGQQTTQITYDPITQKYMKFANGQPQIDGITGEQLEFDNVIVLYTYIVDRENDEANRKWLDAFGGLQDDNFSGYYLSQGGIQKIRWAKNNNDPDGRLEFFDWDGNEIEINRGKTYITYTYIDSATFSDTVPEGYTIQ